MSFAMLAKSPPQVLQNSLSRRSAEVRLDTICARRIVSVTNDPRAAFWPVSASRRQHCRHFERPPITAGHRPTSTHLFFTDEGQAPFPDVKYPYCRWKRIFEAARDPLARKPYTAP